MTRQDLELEIESVILASIRQAPCYNCGGDPFTVRHHAKATAYYLAELVKHLKLEEGKFRSEQPFEEVKKRADKKTDKFFKGLSTKELEELLAGPGLPEEPTSETEEPAPSPEIPSPEHSSQTESPSTDPSPAIPG